MIPEEKARFEALLITTRNEYPVAGDVRRVGSIGYDDYSIVPRGAMAAMVKPLELQIRTLIEYDAHYMRDRIRADLFANGKPLGVHAVTTLPDVLEPVSLEDVMRSSAPELERMVIEEMLGHRRHRRLEIELKHLRDYVERDRWFHFVKVRRAATEAHLRVLSAWKTLRGIS